MCSNAQRQRKNRNERIDPPKSWRRNRQNNHADNRNADEGKCPPERLCHSRNLFEEGVVGGFFGGGAPLHVDGEEVAEEGLGDVQGDAAEEDCLVGFISWARRGEVR